MRWITPLALASASIAFAAPAIAETKIAVVDMVRIMQAHPDTKGLEKKVQEAQQKAQQDLEKAQEKLRTLRQEIQNLHRQSPERKRKEKEYEQRRIFAKFNSDWAVQEAMRTYVGTLEATYQAVRGLVAKYARQNQIDLVLQTTDHQQPLNSQDLADFGIKQRLRVVVFENKALDITDAIIAMIPK